MKIDFRTEAQQKRDARNKMVCDKFLVIRNKYPDAAQTRIFDYMARELNMTSIAIRNICVKQGVYVPKTRARR